MPYDPGLYFYGEEVAMSARLWTSGFNIYAPNRLLLFHLYKRETTQVEQSANHWSDHDNWFELNRKSLVRVHTLLQSLDRAPQQLRPTASDVTDIHDYWLGEQRSLHDYERWAGVNFSTSEISESAERGHFGTTQN